MIPELRRRLASQHLTERERRIARLVLMYRRLEARHARTLPAGRPGRGIDVPPIDRIEQVEHALITTRTYDDFTTTLEKTADIHAATVAAWRTMMNRGREGRARTLALAIQHNPETALAGDVCRAILALYDWQPGFAWELLRRHDVAKVLALAPGEFFRAAFAVAPDEGARVLRQLRSGKLSPPITAVGWRGIANVSFARGEEELSAWALEQAVAGAGDNEAILARAAELRRWYGRRSQRSELDADRPIAFVLLDDSSPQPHQRRRAGQAGPRQPRAILRRLVRRNVRFDGDPALVRRANDLVARTDPDRALDAADTTVWLYAAGRNATAYADVPRGTWLFAIGRLPLPLFGMTPNFPFDERYRPVFASITVDGVAGLRTLTPETLEYLRRYGPVGCADWDTYYLMRAADVPAFLASDAPGSIGAAITRIIAGDDEAAVYDAWRAACADAVQTRIARDADYAAPLPLKLNIDAVCRSVRAKQVVVERTEPGPGGPEINLEFSLDGNLKHQMEVCLDSIVRRASRSIRLFVMCRDHGRSDFDRLAKMFPTVSFVWLPTDSIDYGNLASMIAHITIATMDRLLLPEVLKDVDRVVHHDIDAVCLADIAELADLDLQGSPLAAASSTRWRYLSGFNELRGTAYRLRAQGHPELAEELIARTHLRHKFDFGVFNAGVMVFDLARMRADRFCQEFFPYVERYEMNDQAVLNAYAGNDRFVLDRGWNWCPRLEDLEHPKVVHWAGRFKPWKPAWVRAREIWDAAEADAAATRSAG
ncbi:MAG TPA: glycosyltransferase [Mycobacteriales bacterium]|nr:glycosyltransferase [Mycobacteriales bacterium]